MKDVKEIAKDNKLTNYVRESMQELTKVTWPTKNQAIRLTIIVLGFVFVFAVFLAGTDLLANRGYSELLEWATKMNRPSAVETIDVPVSADAPIELPVDFPVDFPN